MRWRTGLDGRTRPPNMFSRWFADKAIHYTGMWSVGCAFIGLCLSMINSLVEDGSVADLVIECLLLTNLFVMLTTVVCLLFFVMYSVHKYM